MPDDPYRGPSIPDVLGDQLRTVMGLETRPSTFGDWVAAMADVADREGLAIDLDALCATETSPHRATYGGETVHYRCAQDAFIVPFLAEDVEAVEIETASPISGERIDITVSPKSVAVEPPGAVMSFGVSRDVDPAADGAVGSLQAYRYVCPYGNAFASRAEYRTWATQTTALTMPVSVADTVEFARSIGQAG